MYAYAHYSEEMSFESDAPHIHHRREGERERRRPKRSISVGNLGNEYDVNEHVARAPQIEVSAVLTIPSIY